MKKKIITLLFAVMLLTMSVGCSSPAKDSSADEVQTETAEKMKEAEQDMGNQGK